MSGSTKSKGSTSEKKDSGTIATEETLKPSLSGSDAPSTSDTKPDGITLTDGAFTCDEARWKTWTSYDLEGRALITSLTEEGCIAATRWYLKGLQDGFDDHNVVKHDGQVGGKL